MCSSDLSRTSTPCKRPVHSPIPPTNRSSSTLHPALSFPNLIKTLNSGAWAGARSFISVVAVSQPRIALPAFTLVVVGLGLHPIPSLCHHTKAESTAVISFRILRLLLALTPHQPLTPSASTQTPSTACSFPPLFLPQLPPPPNRPPPSLTHTILISFAMTARRSATYQIRPPPKEVFPESTLSPGGLQLTTLFWDTGILFHQGSHAGARVGNNFEVFGCIMTRVFFPPCEFDGRAVLMVGTVVHRCE